MIHFCNIALAFKVITIFNVAPHEILPTTIHFGFTLVKAYSYPKIIFGIFYFNNFHFINGKLNKELAQKTGNTRGR